MTGKNKKMSLEEKEKAIEDKLRRRDKWEKKHLGNLE